MLRHSEMEVSWMDEWFMQHSMGCRTSISCTTICTIWHLAQSCHASQTSTRPARPTLRHRKPAR